MKKKQPKKIKAKKATNADIKLIRDYRYNQEQALNLLALNKKIKEKLEKKYKGKGYIECGQHDSYMKISMGVRTLLDSHKVEELLTIAQYKKCLKKIKFNTLLFVSKELAK